MTLIFKKEVSGWNWQVLEDLKHIDKRANKQDTIIYHIIIRMDRSVLVRATIGELRHKIKYNEDIEKIVIFGERILRYSVTNL